MTREEFENVVFRTDSGAYNDPKLKEACRKLVGKIIEEAQLLCEMILTAYVTEKHVTITAKDSSDFITEMLQILEKEELGKRASLSMFILDPFRAENQIRLYSADGKEVDWFSLVGTKWDKQEE